MLEGSGSLPMLWVYAYNNVGPRLGQELSYTHFFPSLADHHRLLATQRWKKSIKVLLHTGLSFCGRFVVTRRIVVAAGNALPRRRLSLLSTTRRVRGSLQQHSL